MYLVSRLQGSALVTWCLLSFYLGQYGSCTCLPQTSWPVLLSPVVLVLSICCCILIDLQMSAYQPAQGRVQTCSSGIDASHQAEPYPSASSFAAEHGTPGSAGVLQGDEVTNSVGPANKCTPVFGGLDVINFTFASSNNSTDTSVSGRTIATAMYSSSNTDLTSSTGVISHQWNRVLNRLNSSVSAVAAETNSSSSNGGSGPDSTTTANQHKDPDHVSLGVLLGAGSFGKVYRGRWRGKPVAVKILHCCGIASTQQVLHEVDVMMRVDHENVVHTFNCIMWQRQDPSTLSCGYSSSCLADLDPATASFGSSSGSGSSFAVYPVRCSGASSSTGSSTNGAMQLLLEQMQQPVEVPADSAAEDDEGLESRFWIVQELCDAGTLEDAISSGKLSIAAAACTRGRDALAPGCSAWQSTVLGSLDGVQLLYVLLDVARGVRYLHSCNIIHGDLKASNVCLTTAPAAAAHSNSSTSSSRRFVAKVTDFSLTKALAAGATHCSSFTCGTLSHCAPEVLLQGRQSAAADVYAFGMMVWEVLHLSPPFPDCLHEVEIINQVAIEAQRPVWDTSTSSSSSSSNDSSSCLPALKELAEHCWEQDPAARPTFEAICSKLERLLQNAITAAAVPTGIKAVAPGSRASSMPLSGSGQQPLVAASCRRRDIKSAASRAHAKPAVAGSSRALFKAAAAFVAAVDGGAVLGEGPPHRAIEGQLGPFVNGSSSKRLASVAASAAGRAPLSVLPSAVVWGPSGSTAAAAVTAATGSSSISSLARLSAASSKRVSLDLCPIPEATFETDADVAGHAVPGAVSSSSSRSTSGGRGRNTQCRASGNLAPIIHLDPTALHEHPSLSEFASSSSIGLLEGQSMRSAHRSINSGSRELQQSLCEQRRWSGDFAPSSSSSSRLSGAKWRLFDDAGSDVIAAGDCSLGVPHPAVAPSQRPARDLSSSLPKCSSGCWA